MTHHGTDRANDAASGDTFFRDGSRAADISHIAADAAELRGRLWTPPIFSGDFQLDAADSIHPEEASCAARFGSGDVACFWLFLGQSANRFFRRASGSCQG